MEIAGLDQLPLKYGRSFQHVALFRNRMCMRRQPRARLQAHQISIDVAIAMEDLQIQLAGELDPAFVARAHGDKLGALVHPVQQALA